MQFILPLAIVLLILRATRGMTDTIKKYERRGTMAGGDLEEKKLSSFSGYAKGLE
jgi:hypothetical protein